jgi:hypothetical protein
MAKGFVYLVAVMDWFSRSWCSDMYGQRRSPATWDPALTPS